MYMLDWQYQQILIYNYVLNEVLRFWQIYRKLIICDLASIQF